LVCLALLSSPSCVLLTVTRIRGSKAGFCVCLFVSVSVCVCDNNTVSVCVCLLYILVVVHRSKREPRDLVCVVSCGLSLVSVCVL